MEDFGRKTWSTFKSMWDTRVSLSVYFIFISFSYSFSQFLFCCILLEFYLLFLFICANVRPYRNLACSLTHFTHSFIQQTADPVPKLSSSCTPQLTPRVGCVTGPISWRLTWTECAVVAGACRKSPLCQCVSCTRGRHQRSVRSWHGRHRASARVSTSAVYYLLTAEAPAYWGRAGTEYDMEHLAGVQARARDRCRRWTNKNSCRDQEGKNGKQKQVWIHYLDPVSEQRSATL